ncbi:ATP-binding cassette, subfamily B [Sporobacter termitidis DSM 10068]|uniref:ATP-binding cassette, subfamily B n=1 Tax=Sporobacter termitidis DSM 10068 TaxID=1123282 RepID=A0A1M5WLJ6_9FIRM|nr:ABC transporter ATP-binding protein [Sporobacter termitidis]SHH88034.1 ATP-binding cassette, subfamily B [Sporobacter termitidis DSM 10068]
MDHTEKHKRGAFSYLFEWAAPYRGKCALSVVTATLGVLCAVVPYFCVSKIVTLLIAGERSLSPYLFWVVAAALFWAGNYLFHSISTTISHGAAFAVIADTRRRMCEKLARLSMGKVLARPSGVTKNIIVERLDGIEPTLAHVVPEMTSKLLAPVAILIYVFILDWRVALWSLLTFPIGMLAMMGMRVGYEEKYSRYVKSGKNLNAVAVEYINGIEVIKTFSQTAKTYKKFTDAAHESAHSAIDWMKDTQIFFSLGMVVIPSVLVSVLPACVLFYLQGTLPVNEIVVIVVLCLGMMPPLIGAMSYSDDLAKIGTIVGEINSILEDEELRRPETNVQLDRFDIEGKAVRFSYKDTEVLHSVDFFFREGTVNALVGPSGSGKSTLARLIASMWDVTGGSITIGGVDVRDIPLRQLNEMIAYVSQDNFLFNETVRENLRKGRPGATDAEVEASARASGCHEFIMQLEKGYDTMVGSAGGHLSGGERQRLSIARAMLKDAPIVILDEATAYTDPENEAVIQNAVARLVRGKTLIVVAHRLSTITDSDQIVMVRDGHIEAAGTHETLLEDCTLYRHLWETHIGSKDAVEVK